MKRLSLAVCVSLWLHASSAAQDQPKAPPAKAVEMVVTLELTDGSRIVGVAVDLAAVPFRADFGKVEIPLSLIAQAQFSADRSTLQVRFRNNDTLTGQLELETIKLRTPYGDATVPAKRVGKMSVKEGA